MPKTHQDMEAGAFSDQDFMIDMTPDKPKHAFWDFVPEARERLAIDRCFYFSLVASRTWPTSVEDGLKALLKDHSVTQNDIIVFDRCGEPVARIKNYFFPIIAQIAAKNAVSVKRFFTVSQTSALYDTHKFTGLLSWVPYHHYLRRVIATHHPLEIGEFGFTGLYDAPTQFLSLNRKLRPHRWILLRYLEGSSLNPKVLRSELQYDLSNRLGGKEERGDAFTDEISDIIQTHFPSFQEFDLRRYLDQPLPSTSLLEDNGDDLIVNMNPVMAMPVKATKSSHLVIVTETEFEKGYPRVTEKTLKVIPYFRPFIVFGQAGTLKFLHDNGFQTFHPFIDETYDTITDPDQRMRVLIDELHRLERVLDDHDARRKFLDGIKPILHHNAHHLKQAYQDIMDEKAISALLFGLDAAKIEESANPVRP
ncbi:MAG: hypothetical protein AAF198_14015 [Pseudomonadota bacterium]